MEVIEHLADRRLAERAADVQVQLEKGTGTRPLLYVLARARQRACKAIDLFIDVDPADTDEIRRLQAELRLFNDVAEACREMLALGEEASRRITEEDRAELDEIIAAMSDDERRLHNFEPRSKD